MGEEALLEGEPPEWSASDAGHWADVYRELIEFCRRALLDARPSDAALLRSRLQHMEARLAFWERGGDGAEITKP